MELQLLYARILTLLRNEFLAVKWNVYVEEEKSRLVIEIESHLAAGGVRTKEDGFRPGLTCDVNAVKLENGFDDLWEDRLHDDVSKERSNGVVDDDCAIGDVVEVKEEELPPVRDSSAGLNRSYARRPLGWVRDDASVGAVGSPRNDDGDDQDGPGKKRIKRMKAVEGIERRKRSAAVGSEEDDGRGGASSDEEIRFRDDDGGREDDRRRDWVTPPSPSPPLSAPKATSKSAFCTVCHKYFSSKSYLAKHSLNVHGVEIPHSSRDRASSLEADDLDAVKDENDESADGEASTSSTLPEKGPSVCSESGVSFSTASQLLRHRRVSRGIGGKAGGGGKKSTVCGGRAKKNLVDLRCWEPECDGKRVFSSASKLKKHSQAVHGIQIKLKCTECDAEFLTRKGRMEHVRSVHDGVKIQCLHCDKKFTKQRTLNYHMDNSHPEKLDPATLTHICDLCGKIFSSGESLCIHQVAKHRRKDETTPTRSRKSKAAKEGEEIDADGDSVCCPICGRQFAKNKSYLKEGDEVCQCDGSSQLEEATPPKNNRRGQQKRASYSVEKKAEVILEAYKSGMTQGKVAAKFNINRSMVSVWMRDKDKIMDAARKTSKKFSRLRPYTKHARLFETLDARLRECRAQGRLADFGWLWSEARSIHAQLTSNPDASLCAHVVILFLKRYGVRLRAKPKYRKLKREIYEPKLQRWHVDLREKLLRVGKHDFYDRKWGRYLPHQRYALDSCVLPIYLSRNRIVDHYKAGEDAENKANICLTDPSHGLDRRHCSLLICLRAAGEQPRLAVIFRGGRRFGAEEKTLWSPDVDVYFQEKASVDTAIACEWVKHTLFKALEERGGNGGGAQRFVVFCGNSRAMWSPEFEGQIANRGGIVWHGFEDAAGSLWQPIEAGPAQLLKVLIGQAQRTWLETPENSQLWHGETKGFTAKDRRVLITHWAAQAWKKFNTAEYSQFKLNAWQKTGCLMTVDGSEDHLIKPEDIGADYALPPPAPYEPYLLAPQQQPENNFHGDDESTESSARLAARTASTTVSSVPSEFALDEPPIRDDPADRDFNHELVGRQLKVWYEDGWATGRITYYNLKFGMMKVDFPEDTDFVAPHDIDGIEVVLL